MSIALMTMARKTALPTNQKFVLLALADWADDNGASCWPSIYELAEYLTCSERTVQRLLRELEVAGWIAVVGNANGGAAARSYCLNVPRMASESQTEGARREAEKERRRRDRQASNPFNKGCQSVTPVNLSPVTNQVRGVTSEASGVTNQVVRGDTAVTPSTIDPPKNHQRTIVPSPPAPARTSKKAGSTSDETGLQAACRATWAAYSEAYEQRHGAKPIRNAKVNATVKAFVRRIGFDESPEVARFYVDRVADRLVLQRMHDTGLLLSGAEGYRTQWASGRMPVDPLNKQAALEARNRAVADAWEPPEVRAEKEARRAAI